MVIGILITSMSFLSCSKKEDNNTNTDSGGGTNSPAANEVWIQSSTFTPSSITVPVGTKITWTNKDGIAHTVTSNTNIFNSGNMNNNAIFSYTFLTAGTYAYHCTYHSNMTGTVVVN